MFFILSAPRITKNKVTAEYAITKIHPAITSSFEAIFILFL
jgi:hypothetical protein